MLTKTIETYLPLYKKPKENIVEDNPFSIKNGILYKDDKPVRYEKTSKVGGKMRGPRFVIQHYTANNSLDGTISVFKRYSVSSHLIVDTDGTTVQMVPFDKVAWHAGESKTESKWGTTYRNLNSYSIGIEYVNYGYSGKHVNRKHSPLTKDWPRESHKNESSERKWQPYTDEQIKTAEQINAVLMEEYGIPVDHIKGHDEISPTRKVDPGPLFPMEQIKSRLGDRK